MLPTERLGLLIEAIRQDCYLACDALLAENPEEIINLRCDMREEDIARLVIKSERSRDFLVPRATTQCTPIFFAALYNFFDIFKLLHSKGANFQAKTAGEIDLGIFMMGCKVGHRISRFMTEKTPAIVAAAAENPNNPFVSRDASNHYLFEGSTASFELEHLVFYAILGHLDSVNAALSLNTHQKDSTGLVLYEAIKHNQIEIVRALKQAKLTIMPKHYWAAGMAGAEKGPILYGIIKPNQTTPSTTNTAPIPDCILTGNLKGLHATFNTAPDAATQSRWLYHSLAMGYILTTRYLLEKGVAIDLKHYYAAGRCFSNDAPAITGALSTRLFDMLSSRIYNEPLPANFYSKKEQKAYNSVMNPSTADQDVEKISKLGIS